MTRKSSWLTRRAPHHPKKTLLATYDKACPLNFHGSCPRILPYNNKTRKIPLLLSQPHYPALFILTLRNCLSHPDPNNTTRSNSNNSRLPWFCLTINLYNLLCKIDLLSSSSSRRLPQPMADSSLRYSPASRTTARIIITTTGIIPPQLSIRGYKTPTT
jgi:hypothetical protein